MSGVLVLAVSASNDEPLLSDADCVGLEQIGRGEQSVATLDNEVWYRKSVIIRTLAYCAYVVKDFLCVPVVLKRYKAISVQEDRMGTACPLTGKQGTWDGYKIMAACRIIQSVTELTPLARPSDLSRSSPLLLRHIERTRVAGHPRLPAQTDTHFLDGFNCQLFGVTSVKYACAPF